MAVAATGREVISAVADKLGTAEELLLVHLSSAGGGSGALIGLRCAACQAGVTNLLNLRATSRELRHMKGCQFGPIY